MHNAYARNSFNDFLEKEGIATDVKNEAIKRFISYNLLEEIAEQYEEEPAFIKDDIYLVKRIKNILFFLIMLYI